MTPDGNCTAENYSRIVIYTLGRFELLLNGRPLRFKGRAPLRALELLGALIAAGEGGATVGTLADQLWPDSDGFDAYRAFTTTLHRLRRMLGCPDAVRLSAGRVSLETQVCTVDVWAFESALRGAADAEALEAILDTCPGPFLAGDSSTWAVGTRARIQQLIARKRSRIETARHRQAPRELPWSLAGA